jgi:hypothetical protein
MYGSFTYFKTFYEDKIFSVIGKKDKNMFNEKSFCGTKNFFLTRLAKKCIFS